MTTMGRHSPPINGTLLPSFTLPPSLQPRGPVSVLPQPPAPPERRRVPDMDGDTAIRVLAAAVVLAVAAFAAIVSYSHIFGLGRLHGQDGTAARLLPLSVDGLIAAASLVMLHAARRRLPVPGLARWMLALGVGATVAANVEYGLPFGWLAAVISAWPAVAFVGSVEMAVRFVRDARCDDSGRDNPARGQPVVMAHDDDRTRTPPRKPVKAAVRPALTKQARAAAVIRDNPAVTSNAALARLAGCDVRTVQRARKVTAELTIPSIDRSASPGID